MKLTKKQEEVVDLLNKGWELFGSRRLRSMALNYWMRKSGESYAADFSASTIESLLTKKVIKPTPRLPGDGHWLSRFELSTVINFKEELTN